MCSAGVLLHPSHRSPAGIAPKPLRWNEASPSRAERLRDLAARASAAAAFASDSCGGGRFEGQEKDGQGEGESQGESKGEGKADGEGAGEGAAGQVLRTSSTLVIQGKGDDGLDLRVLISLAEVAYGGPEEAAVVALARPTEGGAKQDNSYDVWLLVPTRGKAGLLSLLCVLSQGGAICGDLEPHFDVVRKPFAFGGCACVHEARPLRARCGGANDLPLVAKVLPASDREQVNRADIEAGLLFQAQGHPNIVRIHGVFFCADWLGDEKEGEDWTAPRPSQVLLLDMISRGSLHSRVRRYGTYTEAKALSIVEGLLSALVHIHHKGIVHRDVKPDNILIGANDQPILSDFGIAALVCDAEAMQERCGTPGYAAPEMLISGAPYGKKVDVFGAGVVLYFCVLGRNPFTSHAKDQREVTFNTVKGSVEFPADRGVSEVMRRFSRILLAKSTSDRPSAAAALDILELLHIARSSDELEQYSPRPAEDDRKLSKRSTSQTSASQEKPSFVRVLSNGSLSSVLPVHQAASNGSLSPVLPAAALQGGAGRPLGIRTAFRAPEKPDERYPVNGPPRLPWSKNSTQRTFSQSSMDSVQEDLQDTSATQDMGPSCSGKSRRRQLHTTFHMPPTASWASRSGSRVGSKGSSSSSAVSSWGLWFGRSRKVAPIGEEAAPSERAAIVEEAAPSDRSATPPLSQSPSGSSHIDWLVPSFLKRHKTPGQLNG